MPTRSRSPPAMLINLNGIGPGNSRSPLVRRGSIEASPTASRSSSGAGWWVLVLACCRAGVDLSLRLIRLTRRAAKPRVREPSRSLYKRAPLLPFTPAKEEAPPSSAKRSNASPHSSCFLQNSSRNDRHLARASPSLNLPLPLPAPSASSPPPPFSLSLFSNPSPRYRQVNEFGVDDWVSAGHVDSP